MSAGKILIVDDERSMREFLSIYFKRNGFEVSTAPGGKEALEVVEKEFFNVVITDLSMPRIDGMKVLTRVKEVSPDTAVVVITAFSTSENVREAYRMGATDYIFKPFKVDELKLVVQRALEHQRLIKENSMMKAELVEKYGFSEIVGKSQAMKDVYDIIRKVSDTRTTVLITGESGTGKELVARSLHYSGSRKERPFVAVNCGAMPENLIESELFGHKKGAFTGAGTNKQGLFQAASGGTIFLDEIGEMPLPTQVKLLRVLQDRVIRGVGSVEDEQVDVRVVAATNRILQDEVKAGRFREDLFYRLNVVTLRLPPLRERKDDLPALIQHFLAKYVQEYGRNISGVSPDAMLALQAYSFPGNVRELENLMERAVALEGERIITVSSLPPHVLQTIPFVGGAVEVSVPDGGMDLDAFMGRIERQLLLHALEKSSGTKKRAADLLGISFRSFRYRLAKFGMDDGEEVSE